MKGTPKLNQDKRSRDNCFLKEFRCSLEYSPAVHLQARPTLGLHRYNGEGCSDCVLRRADGGASPFAIQVTHMDRVSTRTQVCSRGRIRGQSRIRLHLEWPEDVVSELRISRHVLADPFEKLACPLQVCVVGDVVLELVDRPAAPYRNYWFSES
jgi:hypothetical protein